MAARSISDDIINSLPGMFYLYDEQGRLVRWNKRHEEVLGYSAEELENKYVLDFFEGKDRDVIAAGVEHVFIDGRAEAEAEVKTKDGRKIPYFFTGVLTVLEDRPHFLGLGIDITGLKRAEAALRKSETRFKQMTDLLPEGVYETDLDGNVTYANQIALEKVGYSLDDLEQGFHLLDLLAPADRSRAEASIQRILATGKRGGGEYTALRKDNSTFPVMTYSAPIVVDGTTVGLRGVVVDISERVAMETQLNRRAGRIIRLHKCLLKLSRLDLADPATQMREILESDARAMRVERVSLWFFNADGSEIACDDLFTLTTSSHENGGTIKAADHPRYFEALRNSRAISADNACDDPRTREFADVYLKPLGVTSMLDAPIWLHAKIVGVVCHEHVGPARTWLPEEQDFAASVADMISLALEAAERGRAEDALARSERQFRDLVEHLPIGIYRSTPEGKMLMANSAMVKMLGYASFDDLASRDLDSECGKHEYARAEYRLRIERDGQAVGLEAIWRKSDGSVIHMRENARAVFDEAGQALYYEGTVEDITEQKRAERELEQYRDHLEELVRGRTTELERANRQLQDEITERTQLEVDLIAAREAAEAANRAKSTFLANMSHGIRTPMNAILGYAQILQRDAGLGEVQRDYVGVINRSGEHLLGLINDVLEMSKIEAGHTALNPQEFDFHGLVADLEAMFRARAAERSLALRVTGTGDVPRYLYADSAKIREVIINLVGNAVKFTREGTISVGVRAFPNSGEGRELALAVDVEDTGCGIAADELERVFEPFEQARPGRYRTGGTGLGLPISREYARMMGGDLVAESLPDKGSVFHFTFKVQAVDAAEARPAAETSVRQVRGLAGGRSPKVLVVDDDEASREALSLHLGLVGFQVEQAADGAEAVGAFEKWQPDAILMDLWMPVLDGLEATRRIKASVAGRVTPILTVTASVLEESERDAKAAGADGFIRKPFRKAEVFAELRRLLGIEYVYDPAPERPTEGDRGGKEGPVDLPAGLVRSLAEATESGDGVTLRTLLEEHREMLGPQLAGQLTDLANHYEYDKIMALVGKQNVGAR